MGARARAGVVERTWDRALERLADGYRAALRPEDRSLWRAA